MTTLHKSVEYQNLMEELKRLSDQSSNDDFFSNLIESADMDRILNGIIEGCD